MPFFWRRRRKLWWGRGTYRPRRKTYRRKRWPRRRRHRRFTRRRRRRRRKVRRKKKTLTLKQWQPDRIVNCKIKGMGTLILGADGKQMLCYTNEKTILTPSRTPGGGGFGIERYTLQYLYEQWKARKNIWTKSNQNTDLVRYTGCKITLYRHQNVDFIINYSRQPPFELNKFTYMSTHPTQMLLGKHKKILQSKMRKTNGKEKLKLFIKPPKTMINKWYFQKQFTEADLFQLTATVASFSFPSIGPTNENQILNFLALNTEFYQNADWGATRGSAYYPFTHTQTNLYFWTKDNRGQWQYKQIDYTSYSSSISLQKGAFQPGVLNATYISHSATPTPDQTGFTPAQVQLPLVPIRYNLPKDTGEGNKVWAHSILSNTWAEPVATNDLTIANVPVWLALWGLASYMRKHLRDYNVLKTYIIIIKSPAISYIKTTSTEKIFPIIGPSMLAGKGPYNTDYLSPYENFWFPSYLFQEESLNAICEASPYVPKLERNRESTWELPYTYCFYFKWGGPEITDQQVSNPNLQDTWIEPYSNQERVQISNPLKQDTDSILHSWDFRRGIITQKALERMCSHLETDSDFEPDTGEPPSKKKKTGCELPYPGEKEQEVQACLQELCKEGTFQEEETQSLQQLIQQQKLQQQQLKHNILILLKDLKLKQKNMQLQMGMLN
nr:MAG: ORF1 [Torque teno midi virus]